MRVVVMGVAGAGKTTVAAAVALRLGARFVDADDAHPPANIAKMSSGIALTDADRAPWLARLRDELAGPEPVVVTCSALKRRYRDVLRQAGGVRFVLLDLTQAEAERRAEARPGHFFGASMVAGQFVALEPPAPDETDVVVIDAARPADDVIADAVHAALEPG